MGAPRGTRSGIGRLCPVLLLVLLVPAASAFGARPLDLTGTGGGSLRGPYKSWARAAHVPLPEGRVRVGLRGCPGRPDLVGCVKIKHPRTIYLRSDARYKRSVFLHELGHVFDLTVMGLRDRRAFKRIHGRAGRGWWAGTHPPASGSRRRTRCARATARACAPAPRRPTATARALAGTGARAQSSARPPSSRSRPKRRKRRQPPPKPPPTLTEPVQKPAPINEPPPPPRRAGSAALHPAVLCP